MNADTEEWVIEYWAHTRWGESDLHNMVLDTDCTFSSSPYVPLFTLSYAMTMAKARLGMPRLIMMRHIVYRLRNVRTGDILPAAIL